MEFQDLSTDALVQLVRDGTVAAFGAIVTRYQLDVLRKVNLLLLDKISAEDMVQEVFFRAFTRLAQYRMGSSFRNWLIGITQNTVLQELRRSKRYTGRLVRYASLVESRLSAQEPAADDGRERALLDCIQHLDSRSAEIVRARYSMNAGIEEIAQSQGRTAGAVRTLLYRARAQLRTCMEKKGTWR